MSIEVISPKQYIEKQTEGHKAIYISQDGMVFDCMSYGSHRKFTIEFYKNFLKLKAEIPSDYWDNSIAMQLLNFANEITAENIKKYYFNILNLKEIRKYNDELFVYVDSDDFSMDKLLVNDLGFVRLVQMPSRDPVINLPNRIYNAKLRKLDDTHMTAPQYDAVDYVLDNSATPSATDYKPISIIRKAIKVVNKTEKDLTIVIDKKTKGTIL